MILEELVAPSFELLRTQYSKNQLLLVHPDSRTRLLLLAALLENPPCSLFFYQLRVTDISLSTFLTSLVYELANQSPGFGYHLLPVLREMPENLEAVAAAFIDDLADLAQEDLLLILDDFDYCDAAPAIPLFFEHALDALPDQCHLLISSRTVPSLPWIALIARQRAVVLKDARLSTQIVTLSTHPDVN